MVNAAIDALVQYGISHGLIGPADTRVVTNTLLSILELEEYTPSKGVKKMTLVDILTVLLEDAVDRGVIRDSITARDLLDTKLMGVLTPYPSWVIEQFRLRYKTDKKSATDWFYGFCQDTDYIRRYRIERDRKWETDTKYGPLDITINLSKPEKDPRDIAAAKDRIQSGYPKCMLCSENEGFEGNMGHPARQNHRLIPVEIDGESWFFQYSPYVYYNEHCIALNGRHVPMAINEAAFRKLVDFLKIFPHYFVGSNADLPIVGGSILTHDHFQGGRYVFAMEKAHVYQALQFPGYDAEGGLVHWPMSVLRLKSKNEKELIRLASDILARWRSYSDASVGVLAYTSETPHNTITPIARKRGDSFEFDLVLRNNRTTKEHPMGLFHPHEELHHIKKENIGLIEVMGLAVLPGRLLEELMRLKELILAGQNLNCDSITEKHALWAEGFLKNYERVDAKNIDRIIEKEVGLVFEQVLEDAGVFKNTPEGKQAFLRFIYSCGGEVVH